MTVRWFAEFNVNDETRRYRVEYTDYETARSEATYASFKGIDARVVRVDETTVWASADSRGE
jgi:hypothetical protein